MGLSLGNVLDYLEGTGFKEHEAVKSIVLEVLGGVSVGLAGAVR
jgi:hypothetical protein